MTTNGAARDLTLMLILLTSWLEKPGSVRRCWKGFRFEILDSLAEEGLISGGKGAKSLYLTEMGERRARELLLKHGFGVEAQ
jgi:Domain of unknown function (DUF6429)